MHLLSLFELNKRDDRVDVFDFYSALHPPTICTVLQFLFFFLHLIPTVNSSTSPTLHTRVTISTAILSSTAKCQSTLANTSLQTQNVLDKLEYGGDSRLRPAKSATSSNLPTLFPQNHYSNHTCPLPTASFPDSIMDSYTPYIFYIESFESFPVITQNSCIYPLNSNIYIYIGKDNKNLDFYLYKQEVI